jgi:hypothetical protein
VPLEHLVAYMVAAKSLLAPNEADFFRQMGRFAGERDRNERAFSHMVADRDTAIRMLRVLWHAYYGGGSLEILSADDQRLVCRAVDFKGDPVLCERITGVAEGQLRASRAEHGACVFRGDPACEWTLWW